MTLNNDSKYLTLAEVLGRINDDITSLDREYKFAPGSALQTIFHYAFDDKWALPEGNPPFTPNKFAEGSSPLDLLVVIKKGRLEYFSGVKYPNLSKAKREELFIRTLESIHPKEAEVVLLIKDQNLSKKYPNITRDVLVKYGYLPEIKNEIEEEKPLVFSELKEVKTADKSEPAQEKQGKRLKEVKVKTTGENKKSRGRPRKTQKERT